MKSGAMFENKLDPQITGLTKRLSQALVQTAVIAVDSDPNIHKAEFAMLLMKFS